MIHEKLMTYSPIQRMKYRAIIMLSAGMFGLVVEQVAYTIKGYK